MLRLETETGWWLVTHPDHARLAGAFAERWGNDVFVPPEPRANVLKGIASPRRWLDRPRRCAADHAPGKAQRLLVRAGRQVFGVRGDRPRGLSCRARPGRSPDRRGRSLRGGTHFNAHIQPFERSRGPVDHCAGGTAACWTAFLEGQKAFQTSLRQQISSASDRSRPSNERSSHPRPLPATAGHRLSFLAHLRQFLEAGDLLHPLPTRGGEYARVEVRSAGTRHFVLDPYPFAEPSLTFTFPARHVEGKLFASAAELQREFAAAPVETLSVTVSAS